MKIFTRYMAGKFFKPFLFGLGIFALLIFLGDLFDRMNALVKSKASMALILEYLWLEVPYWSIRVIPMATLLATLVSITGFVQSGEWIAAQACGFKTSDFWKPVLWCSLLVTVLSFAAQETALPYCYGRAGQLWRDYIHPEWEWDKYYDVALIGRENQFLQAQYFRVSEGKMERPILEQNGPDGIERQLDAKLALWNEAKGHWVFYDGVDRRFNDSKVREEPFKERDSDLDAPPKTLVPRSRSPEEMSLREILADAQRSRHTGASRRDYAVAAHAKVAYPFTNFIICAMGIPVALRLRKAAKAVSFCTALALSFLYLWCIEAGQTLGKGGDLPPAAAAWSANVVFACVALWLIRRYDV